MLLKVVQRPKEFFQVRRPFLPELTLYGADNQVVLPDKIWEVLRSQLLQQLLQFILMGNQDCRSQGSNGRFC